MNKKGAIIIIVCFFLTMMMILMQGINYEFRWIWLSITTMLAFPVVLILLLFKRLLSMKRIWVKIILFPLAIFGVLYLAFLYQWFGASVDAKQYSFKSPTHQKEVITKEYHVSLFTGGIDFYVPKLFIFKKRMNAEHHSTEECLPFARGDYRVNWLDDEITCEVRWKGSVSSRTLDQMEAIQLN